MPETKQLLRETRDRIAPPPDVLGGLERRRRHQENVKRVAAAAVALVVALVGLGGWFVLERHPAPRLGDRSDERSKQLGIFAPVAGRILFVDDENGVLAVDPNGPTDTQEGLGVAPDVASTLVPLELEGEPVAWSRDGSELLFTRSTGDLIVKSELYVLHADGSESPLAVDPMFSATATFTPDGRVVFVSGDGLYVVDPDGGTPERIGAIPGSGWSVTWSPDGSQIAYLTGNRRVEVWVANADGTDAHQILADEPTELRDTTGLAWSPAGDRLALGAGTHEPSGGSIYTFAPDGSDFTPVIVGGSAPVWSPDGSQIAYSIQCDFDQTFTTCIQFDSQTGRNPPGLAIADADGSDAQAFGFAASGPWHPGASATDEPVPSPVETPTPMRSDSFARVDGEVFDRIAQGEAVNGWPTTSKNHAGVYSWDGSACGPPQPQSAPPPDSGPRSYSRNEDPPPSFCSVSSAGGFMHNGYGSGDVAILLSVLPEGSVPGEGVVVSVAGRTGVYRRIDARRERWIVDIAGTTISIRMNAEPGTSRADLEDGHAIIGSMRAQAQDSYLGFRLVFILTNGKWDSG